jgi:hypothetical protein
MTIKMLIETVNSTLRLTANHSNTLRLITNIQINQQNSSEIRNQKSNNRTLSLKRSLKQFYYFFIN